MFFGAIDLGVVRGAVGAVGFLAAGCVIFGRALAGFVALVLAGLAAGVLAGFAAGVLAGLAAGVLAGLVAGVLAGFAGELLVGFAEGVRTAPGFKPGTIFFAEGLPITAFTVGLAPAFAVGLTPGLARGLDPVLENAGAVGGIPVSAGEISASVVGVFELSVELEPVLVSPSVPGSGPGLVGSGSPVGAAGLYTGFCHGAFPDAVIPRGGFIPKCLYKSLISSARATLVKNTE